jgi:ABC-type nitrate/sulfonate/bicarbonate transport system substrate-binding protein
MFGRILISSLVIFFLASPGGAKDKLRISVAGFDGSSELLLVIGQGAQLFEKHGLKIELIAITGAAPSSSVLSRGETDIDARAPVSAIQTKLKGLDFTFVAAALNYLDYAIITRPDVRFGGKTDLLVRYLFRSAGLEPVRDFAVLQIGPPTARIGAIQSGVIDATMLPPSQAYTAVKVGLKTMDIPYAPFLSGVLVTREAFVKTERPTLTHFLRAYVEAIHFFLTRKEESLGILARAYRNSDRGWVEHLYRTHQQHQIGRKPFPNWEGVQATLDMMVSDTPGVKNVKPRQLFDLTVLDELERAGFIEGLYAH